MEPTKQVDADPSGLDDPGQPRDGSSSRQPPRWPLLEQEQEPAMAPLMHMPLVERATPPPPNSPQLLQPQGHDVVGGSSTLAGFRSNYDIWGLDIAGAPVARPMFHPDSRWPSTPNFINNQFSGAAAPFSASGHYTSLSPHAFVPLTAPFANQPAPSFNQRPSASHWASMPSSSSANGPQPGAATAFFPRGHNASLDPYAFPRLAAPLANQADGSQLLSSPQAICFLTDEQFRARLFGCPRLPSLVMSREISARRVVLMLHEGDDRDLRLWVLDAILRNVHMVMGSRAGSAVCLALLRAVLPQELCCIVQATSSPPLDRTSLMGVANRKPGEIALKELFWAVAQIPQLCWPLFNCLVNGWIMEQSNGPELLRHFFTTLDYYYCRIFIRHLALPGFAGMVTSEFGWRCMLICLNNARDDGTYTELPDLEQAILSGTVDIAKTKYGNCFLQEVLKSGRYIQLQECIRERVERNLEGLSAHHFGNYMVQACYVPLAREPELPLLRRGLEAFFALRDGPLYEVVHDRYASRLLCKLLLLTAEKDMETASPWKRTVALAQRIQGMLRASQDETSRQVMQVVEKVISAAQRRR